MNERIRELAQQAGLQPFEDCGPGYVHKMEKFAELIVKEFRDLMIENIENQLTEDGIVLVVKEHFGVKE